VPQLRSGQPLRIGHRHRLRALLGLPHPGALSLSLSLPTRALSLFPCALFADGGTSCRSLRRSAGSSGSRTCRRSSGATPPLSLTRFVRRHLSHSTSRSVTLPPSLVVQALEPRVRRLVRYAQLARRPLAAVPGSARAQPGLHPPRRDARLRRHRRFGLLVGGVRLPGQRAGAPASLSRARASWRRTFLTRSISSLAPSQWRNWGILVAFFIGISIIQAAIAEIVPDGNSAPRIDVFAHEDKERKELNERLQANKERYRKGEVEQDLSGLIKSSKAFTWEDLTCVTSSFSPSQAQVLTLFPLSRSQLRRSCRRRQPSAPQPRLRLRQARCAALTPSLRPPFSS